MTVFHLTSQAPQVMLVVETLPANAGVEREADSIPGSGRSPGGGRGNPLQSSCLKNPHGQRSQAGYSPRGGKELGMMEQLSTHARMSLARLIMESHEVTTKHRSAPRRYSFQARKSTAGSDQQSASNQCGSITIRSLKHLCFLQTEQPRPFTAQRLGVGAQHPPVRLPPAPLLGASITALLFHRQAVRCGF